MKLFIFCLLHIFQCSPPTCSMMQLSRLVSSPGPQLPPQVRLASMMWPLLTPGMAGRLHCRATAPASITTSSTESVKLSGPSNPPEIISP